jgi:hypothetical protein
MTIRWRSVMFLAAMLVCGTSAHAQIVVLPLVDEADPIKLSDAAFDGTDPERPAITLRLENMSALAFSTDRIWLSFQQVYTPEEVSRRKEKSIWGCGLVARANHDQPKRALELLPGASLDVRIPLGQDCTLNPQHEHFWASVSRIATTRRSLDSAWKREAREHGRLLQAALLKAH